MRKNKKILISLTVIFCLVAISSVVFTMNRNNNNDASTYDDEYILDLIESAYGDSDNIVVNASYSDSAESFEELENTADFIVMATVESVEKRIAGQVATLSVSEIFKGNVQQSILLYQTLDDDNVKVGKEYILFMNEQTGDEAQNDYYPVAGGRGVVLVYESSNETIVEIDSEKLNSQALIEWLDENFVSLERTSISYKIVTRE